ncbi:hypothetical protein HW115_19080 [Verrucomicrobiaceae bacterium N1E253]|uniref:Uncharacterized protein n=1 Tax=Oceaniferula marina TaxID=2748318 RepID=A0A851GSH2_9BACT|nr:hypothetical protein [Oceaniferula marina]NWK57730.1 hypothetical protein [Oceaniferula marina]
MKIDPVEVFSNALAIAPIRFLFAWLSASLGGFVPMLLADGSDAFEGLGWYIPMFPFHLVVTAFMSSWWGVIAVPLILVIAYRLCRFMTSDNTGSELMVIFTLAFMISVKPGVDARMVPTIVCSTATLVATYFLVKRDRELYPE